MTSGFFQDNRRRSEFDNRVMRNDLTDRCHQLIYLKYNGVIEITADLGAILSGRPDSKSTNFGNACNDFRRP